MNRIHLNVGATDRMARIVLAAGAVLGAGVVGFSSPWGIVLLVVAAILVLTGAVGYCPAYTVLHVDTRSHHDAGHGGAGSVGAPHPL